MDAVTNNQLQPSERVRFDRLPLWVKTMVCRLARESQYFENALKARSRPVTKVILDPYGTPQGLPDRSHVRFNLGSLERHYVEVYIDTSVIRKTRVMDRVKITSGGPIVIRSESSNVVTLTTEDF